MLDGAGLGGTAGPDAAPRIDADQPGVDSSVRRGGCGITAFGQALTATQVRMLACDAQIIPAVLGTKGEILELGRARRLATPCLVTYLWERDRGCTYPGCRMPPAWCDAHHLRHWLTGGPTDHDNLALLCRAHHTVVHRHRHTGQVTPHGVRWHRDDGTPIGNHPRLTTTSSG